MERRQLAGGGAALRRGALAVLGVALVPAGCGGSSPSFAARANAICVQRAQAARTVPVPASAAEAAQVFDRQSRIAEEEARSLAALGAPDGKDAALHGLVSQVQAEIDANRFLRVAALIGDGQQAQGALSLGRRAAARARAYARELGLRACP